MVKKNKSFSDRLVKTFLKGKNKRRKSKVIVKRIIIKDKIKQKPIGQVLRERIARRKK